MKIKDKYYKETEYLLYNYKMFKINIETTKNEIERLKTEEGKDIGVSGIDYDGIKVSPTNKVNSIIEDIALSEMEYIQYKERSIKRMQEKIDTIDKVMEGLNQSERDIIGYRYIKGLSWLEVAYMVRYNERWCKELRKRAINKMAIGIFGETALFKHE